MPVVVTGAAILGLTMPVGTIVLLCGGPQMPFMMKFHESHQEPVEELLNTKEWQLIESLLTNMMDTYFPAIANKYRCCDEYWQGRTNGVIKAISSLFFLVSINASLSECVKTWPHRDRKNVAIGICTVFIFGFFDDTEQAWLVNLEANIVVQLPTGGRGSLVFFTLGQMFIPLYSGGLDSVGEALQGQAIGLVNREESALG
ncbi:hypothetical protein BS47DRAFT_1369598 [Hydnum rufescens UP504]|uniref:Uncharacterized protein n=1 Tax=Hydnum rufescens UP504 TaxID=1448309 RepID=A0A9P6DF23_9AGAM|nr:hypothetical protein BS47DRAFT_1369598 [Hydnum rufescens UP504]